MIKVIRIKIDTTPKLKTQLLVMLKVAYIIYNWGVTKTYSYIKKIIPHSEATKFKNEFENKRKLKILTNHENRLFETKELAIINSVPVQIKHNQFNKIISMYNKNFRLNKKYPKFRTPKKSRANFTLRAANTKVFTFTDNVLNVANMSIPIPEKAKAILWSGLNIEFIDFKLLNGEWYLVIYLFNKKYSGEPNQKFKKYKFDE